MRLAPLATVLAASVVVAACNQTTAPAPGVGSTNMTSANFRMPEGTGCQGEVARYRTIMANDLAMGHVNRSVYGRVEKEIDQAQSTCAAGRDAEAVRMIEATKGRYGYR